MQNNQAADVPFKYLTLDTTKFTKVERVYILFFVDASTIFVHDRVSLHYGYA